MNDIERIKMLCQQASISISKLEKDCGFSNAYIRGLSEGKIPIDRLIKIACYFDVSLEWLATGTQKSCSVNPANTGGLVLSKLERNVIENFRLADSISRAMVLRALNIDPELQSGKSEKLA